jgi:hypothetical protein
MPLERFSEFLVRQLLPGSARKAAWEQEDAQLWIAIAPTQERSGFERILFFGRILIVSLLRKLIDVNCKFL